MLGVYFEQVKDWYPDLNQTMLYISSAILVVILTTLAFILDKSQKPFNTRCVAMAGITVAMSFGLSYIKLWEMPQGGSVTLASLLPVMIFSFIYGTKKGVFVCLIYGILQAIQDPWIIHPAQFLLDYPIAFTAVGLAGIFKSSKINDKAPRLAFSLGCGAVGLFRYIAHTLSGIFAFEAYAKGQNAVLFSLGYNLYVLVDIALVIAVGALILSSKSLTKELTKARS
jgi:thiamine transporter